MDRPGRILLPRSCANARRIPAWTVFVLVLFTSMGIGSPAIHAQVAGVKIAHRSPGIVLISATGPDTTTLQVHFNVGVQPKQDFNRVVAIFQDAGGERETSDEDLTENVPSREQFTRTTRGTADEFVFGPATTAEQTEQRL